MSWLRFRTSDTRGLDEEAESNKGIAALALTVLTLA
jgi:hypothetical protein